MVQFHQAIKVQIIPCNFHARPIKFSLATDQPFNISERFPGIDIYMTSKKTGNKVFILLNSGYLSSKGMEVD